MLNTHHFAQGRAIGGGKGADFFFGGVFLGQGVVQVLQHLFDFFNTQGLGVDFDAKTGRVCGGLPGQLGGELRRQTITPTVSGFVTYLAARVTLVLAAAFTLTQATALTLPEATRTTP